MPDRAPSPRSPSLEEAFLHGPFVRPPRTRVGWASIALAAAYVAVAAVHRLVLARVADGVPSRATLLAFAEGSLLTIGVATAATVAIALWRRGERSWMLGVPLTIGLGTLVFALGAVVGSA